MAGEGQGAGYQGAIGKGGWGVSVLSSGFTRVLNVK